MKIKPDQTVRQYVAQIARSLQTSERYSVTQAAGLNSPNARRARLKYWKELAQKAGVPDETINQVAKEFTRRYEV